MDGTTSRVELPSAVSLILTRLLISVKQIYWGLYFFFQLPGFMQKFLTGQLFLSSTIGTPYILHGIPPLHIFKYFSPAICFCLSCFCQRIHVTVLFSDTHVASRVYVLLSKCLSHQRMNVLFSPSSWIIILCVCSLIQMRITL